MFRSRFSCNFHTLDLPQDILAHISLKLIAREIKDSVEVEQLDVQPATIVKFDCRLPDAFDLLVDRLQSTGHGVIHSPSPLIALVRRIDSYVKGHQIRFTAPSTLSRLEANFFFFFFFF